MNGFSFNVDDFPASATEPFEVDVIHPDAFLVDQWGLIGATAAEIVYRQLAGYTRPSMTPADLANSLRKTGCDGFAAIVESL